MPSSPSSSSLLLLLLTLARPAAATEDAVCGSGTFRSGQDNFVLDSEDAVRSGAVLLSTAHVLSEGDCQRECCEIPRCNLALLEPRGKGAAENRTCVMFNCVHRNRFVCRFVNQVGYQSYIRESVYRKHLQGPQGTGEESPPIAIAGRDVITQPGETVTLSGIESLALGDAHIADYQWTQLSGDDGIKMEKTEFSDQVRLSHLQPGSSVFQLTVTDSNGQSHATKVNVLVLSPEQTTMFCRAPLKVGPCRAAFPRWRYDAKTSDCEKFVFGGCKGNNNNYLTKNECLTACSGVKVSSERSSLPAEDCVSACRPHQLICSSGCCVDRSLECDGVKDCGDGSDEEHCSQLNRTFSRLLNIDVNQQSARCSEPPHTGPCRASFPRWYYDPMNRKCFTFTYGGCDGNGNNFEEEDECRDACRGVTEDSVFFKGLFDRFEMDEDGDSGNIALAVLLSVAILALLAILTYCFLKSRKKHAHRPVSTGPAHTGPAHTAASEEDTLVYNSTTKPI